MRQDLCRSLIGVDAEGDDPLRSGGWLKITSYGIGDFSVPKYSLTRLNDI